MSAFKIAHLENDQSNKIQDLENELDVCVIALEPGLEIAQLNEEQLARVKQVEKEIEVTLVVYSKC
jgi:hypothetical protein